MNLVIVQIFFVTFEIFSFLKLFVQQANCLSKPLPGLPPATYVSSSKQAEDSRITVLDNGIKVASEKRFGQFCTVGVAIDSGSR